jgi:hypothetical protein
MSRPPITIHILYEESVLTVLFAYCRSYMSKPAIVIHPRAHITYASGIMLKHKVGAGLSYKNRNESLHFRVQKMIR